MRRLLICLAVGLAACGSDADTADTVAAAPVADPADTDALDADAGSSDADPPGDDLYPDVVGATARESNDLWTFDVTLSSPYDTPERYADGWRILGPDGTEYGFRLLTHHHASEQPFTRSLSDVAIPGDVDVVTIEGRDQLNGFGGTTFELRLE